jgi:hypothetical protein
MGQLRLTLLRQFHLSSRTARDAVSVYAHVYLVPYHTWVLLLLLLLLLFDAVSNSTQWLVLLPQLQPLLLLLLLLLCAHVHAKAKLLFVLNVVQLPCES